jgi:hypothetical protein
MHAGSFGFFAAYAGGRAIRRPKHDKARKNKNSGL